jgi:hypothetical protein
VGKGVLRDLVLIPSLLTEVTVGSKKVIGKVRGRHSLLYR